MSTGRISPRSVFFRLGLGLNFADGMGTSVAAQLQGYYRLHKYVAIGLHLAFLHRHPIEVPGAEMRAWSLFLGPEGRAMYWFQDKFEIWGSLALGLMHTQVNSEIDLGYGDVQKTSAGADNFAVGFGLGGDYYFTSKFSAGLNLSLYLPVGAEGGGKVSVLFGLNATYILPL